MCLEIFQSTNETNRRGQGVLFQRFLACEQALPLGDIVKSRRTRGTREETRKRGTQGEGGGYTPGGAVPRSRDSLHSPE